jgi:hypothetical protein
VSTVTLKSGRKLTVAIAPYSAANKLRKVILAEIAQVDVAAELKIDAKMLGLDVREMSGPALQTVKNLICRLLSSDAIEAAFFECAQKSLLDGVKITRETFEPPEARGDMLPVAQEVIRANVAPFFEGLDLSFLTPAAPATASPP